MRLTVTILFLLSYIIVKSQSYSFKYPTPLTYDYVTTDSCIGHLKADSCHVFSFDGTLPSMTGLIQVGNIKFVPAYYIVSVECTDKTKNTKDVVYFQNN